MKSVDISGFGHSGKTVVSDIIREFEGYNVPHVNFEFNLIRIQGGILDLQNALVDNWSPIRSDAAIRKFINLIEKIGPPASFKNPISLLRSNGMNYQSVFNNKFLFHSYNYINSLIDFKYEGYWPYQIVEENAYKQLLERIKSFLGIGAYNSCIINVAAPEKFEIITRSYIQNLFKEIIERTQVCFVTHNALEPFSPTKGLKYFDNGKVIIVYRDPRDIYSSVYSQEYGFNPDFENKNHWKIKNSFLRIDDVNEFIYRQKLYFNQVKIHLDNKSVLRLRYEDLILNYDSTLSKIYNFLEEDQTIHKYKFKYFDPKLSINNIGLWKKNPNKKNIEKIFLELNQYCYNKE